MLTDIEIAQQAKMLKIGRMTTDENGKRQEYAIAGGLFYFRGNKAEILTDAIEEKSEIDVDRAKAAKERAEKRLQEKAHDTDIYRAEVALLRAMARINVLK